jgi:hypothetical protein
MASQIDFVIAAGLFILFTVTIITLLMNYLNNYFSTSSVVDLTTLAYDAFYNIFSAPGIPSNWETSSSAPVKLGLTTNLYQLPFIINETNGTARNNYAVNATFNFDLTCQNKAWNTTVRIYDSNNNPVPLRLFNQTYCGVSQYLNTADAVFNVNLTANSQAKFFMYYSSQQKILPNFGSYSYPNAKNYTVTIYPEITIQSLSVDKLLALRNLSYNQVAQSLSGSSKFYIEVGR